jgi:cell division FtsZ-interacting protein ZapD
MDAKRQQFKEKLELLLSQKTKTEVAKELKMSRQGLYKWLKVLEIDYKNYSKFNTLENRTIDSLLKKADELLNANK